MVKTTRVAIGALKSYTIDYDAELVHLDFWSELRVTLSFAEAKYLRHGWSISLTRENVAYNKSREDSRGRKSRDCRPRDPEYAVVEVPRLAAASR